MSDQPRFDHVLERRLEALSRTASRPFDAGEVARGAIASGRHGRRAAAWLARGRSVALVVAVGVLIGLVLAGALIAGGRLFRDGLEPRSTSILAIGTSGGLILADASGANGRLVDDRGPFFTPRWSADGRRLVIGALLPEDMNSLLVFDPAGTLVATERGANFPVWSPDGTSILVQTTSGRLRIIHVDRPRQAPLAVPLPAGTRSIAGADWLADGRIVASLWLDGEADDAHGLWILDPTTGATRRMTGDAGVNATEPVVAPDGRLVAFGTTCPPIGACEARLRIVDVATGVRRADVESVRVFGQPAWAPDRTEIAYSYRLPTGRITVDWWALASEVVHIDPWSDGDTMLEQVLPAGEGLLVRHVEAGTGSAGLWRVPLDGSSPQLLAPDVFGGALQPARPLDPPSTPIPAPFPAAWVPPAFEGAIPARVAERDAVPFCGVNDGALDDRARACLRGALLAGQVVELATDRVTADGWRLVTILRTTPAGGGQIVFMTDPSQSPPLWEVQTCDRITARDAEVEIGGCGPLSTIR